MQLPNATQQPASIVRITMLLLTLIALNISSVKQNDAGFRDAKAGIRVVPAFQ
jgi:hypothetical protein